MLVPACVKHPSNNVLKECWFRAHTHTNKVGVLRGLKGMFSPLVGSKQAEMNSVSANKNVNSAVALRAECISVSSD